MSKPLSRDLVGELFKLGWPVLIAQLAVMANGVIDTIMAGRHGTVDLAAVGISGAIFFSVFGPLMGIQIAITPIVARLFGAGRHADIGEEVRQGMWLSLILSAIAFAAFRFPDPFITLTRAEPAVEALIREYLSWIAWGVPSALMFRLFASYTTAVSRPRMVMTLNLIGLALKVPLNWVFMYGHFGMPEMGAPGCALSTTLISYAMCCLAWYLSARDPEYRRYGVFARWSWPDLKALREVVSLGLPIGVTFFVDVTAFTFMALFVARLGAVTSASHQIAANLAALMFMLPLSLGNACGVLVGQALGAHDYVRARSAGMTGVALGFGLALIVAAVLFGSASSIAALYSVDSAVRATAATLIALVAGYHLFDAVQAVAVNILRSYKRAVVPMLIYGVGLWCVGLAGGYLLAFGTVDLNWLGIAAPMGARGFWTGAIGGMMTSGLAVAAYFFYISDPRRTEREEIRNAA
jgi:MATE family multidrug resistance protein